MDGLSSEQGLNALALMWCVCLCSCSVACSLKGQTWLASVGDHEGRWSWRVVRGER
jgi:hypothetical protein